MPNILDHENSRDIALEVLSYLSGRDLMIVSQVSKHLHKLSNNTLLWERLSKREGVSCPDYAHPKKAYKAHMHEALRKELLGLCDKSKHTILSHLINNKAAAMAVSQDPELIKMLDIHPTDLGNVCLHHRIKTPDRIKRMGEKEEEDTIDKVILR